MMQSKMQANAAPPAICHLLPGCPGYVTLLLVAAVVVTVSVAVPALDPVMFTGLVVPKVTEGAFWAPAGADAIAAVSVTLPTKPPEGVTVTVDVFPCVAPAVRVTGVPDRVNAGVTGAATTTDALPAAGVKSESPE
jgi:hypothetical protein